MERGKHAVADMYVGWYRQMQRKKAGNLSGESFRSRKLERLTSVENCADFSHQEVNTRRAHIGPLSSECSRKMHEGELMYNYIKYIHMKEREWRTLRVYCKCY